MNWRIMRWAWAQNLKPRIKIILLALASHADNQFMCWPSVKTLAKMSNISTRTVHRGLSILCEQGLLDITPQYRGDNSRKSSLYKLNVTPTVNLSEGCVDIGDGDKTPLSEPQVTNGVSRTNKEHILELPQPYGRGTDVSQETLPLDTSYLERLIPDELSTVFARALECPLVAQELLDELAGRMKKAEVRNPIGYMNSLVESVKSGRFEPQLGLRIAAARKRKLEIEHTDRNRLAQTNTGPTEKSNVTDMTKVFEDLRRAMYKKTGTDSDPEAEE